MIPPSEATARPNSSIVFPSRVENQEHRTFLISGVARGGTSLAASICANIGIPLGKQGPRYENPWLQKALLANRLDVVAAYVETLNSYWPVWGWKLPALVDHLAELERMTRNPYFIFIIKDPCSIAISKADRRDNTSFKDKCIFLKRTLLAYMKIIEFAKNTQNPCLLLSYEKATKDLNVTISEVADFCQLKVDDVEEITAIIHGDSSRYKNITGRIAQYGEIDHLLERVAIEKGFPVEVRRRTKRKSALK